jgi:hypothetical protein
MDWIFRMEESDFENNPKMMRRFPLVHVTQRINLCDTEWLNKSKINTWFRGENTNTFNRETPDKQKKKIITMIEDYLLANDHPIMQTYRKDLL